MHPQTKIVGETVDGLIRAIVVDENGALLGGGGTGGGGGGDASSINQLTQTERLVEIRDRLPATGAATQDLQYVQRDLLEAVRDRLPTSVGAKTAAFSLPVTLSSDGAFSTNFGTSTEAAATSDAGTFSFLSFLKRLLSIKLPSALSSDRFKVEATQTSTQRTTALISTTSAGTIAAGSNSCAIANIGAAAGTVKGVSFPAGTGASISFAANGNDTLDSINYSATNTTFLITTVT